MNAIRLLLGILCGVAATGPMSAMMVWLHQRLPQRERYSLPPREITTKVFQRMGGGAMQPETRSALTWLAHFGYGGAAGSLYAEARRLWPAHPAVLGPIFGLVVWTVSYLGLLPGLRILTPATRHPVRRSSLMIVAHFVWGWCLAVIYEVLSSDLRQGNTAFHKTSRAHADKA